MHNISELGIGLLKQRFYGRDTYGQVRLERFLRDRRGRNKVLHNIGELGIGFCLNKGSTAETRTGKSDWSIRLENRRVRNKVFHNIGELVIGLLKQGFYG